MNCVGAVLAARRLRPVHEGTKVVKVVTVLCDSGSRGVSRQVGSSWSHLILCCFCFLRARSGSYLDRCYVPSVVLYEVHGIDRANMR